ncbi:MAG TPA: hypothetical protein VM537_01005 [Anaerolineae bacterium]|nr:hypothetical protein [Anaerolineae bacterium]
MADIVNAGLAQRQAQMRQRLGELAYERYRLMQRVDEIDRHIMTLEGAQEAGAQVQKDLQTQLAIDKAQAEAAANTDKEAPNA